MYNIEAERYVKRSEGLSTETILNWQKAIKKTTREYLTSRQLFFKLPNVDGLWNSDVFSKSASSHYLARTESVSVDALGQWQTALKRISGNDLEEDLSETLLRVIEVDQLFDGTTFNGTASAEMVGRLNLLSGEDVAMWAAALNTQNTQAAISMASTDAFFKNGEFRTGVFQKKLESFVK